MTPPSALRTFLVCALLAHPLACDVEPTPAPPAPPELGLVQSPTSSPELVLRGSKLASTSVEVTLNGAAAGTVPLDELTSWTLALALAPGANAISAVAVDGAGRTSEPVAVDVLLDQTPPDAPLIEPLPARTLADEVTLRGTIDAGDRVVVNGVVVPLAPDDTDFDLVFELAPGRNRSRVATLDVAGNESDVVVVEIERVAAVVFTLDTAGPVVTNDASFTVAGTRDPDVDVIVALEGSPDAPTVLAADGVGGAWSVDVALSEGDNVVLVSARFANDALTSPELALPVLLDTGVPALTLTSPVASAIVGDVVGGNGTVLIEGTTDPDAPGESDVTLTTCIDPVGAAGCDVDGDFLVQPVAGTGVFSVLVDVGARNDIVDGALVQVRVRATDAAGNRSELGRDVVLVRAPVALAEGDAPGASVSADLAAALPFGGALAWSNAAGAVGISVDDDGAAFAPVSTVLAAAGASAPAIARAGPADDPGSVAHVAWLEESAAFPGANDVRYAREAAAPLALHAAIDALTGAGGVDVAADAAAGGAAVVVAYAVGDAVLARIDLDGDGTFDDPLTLSDAQTLAPVDVQAAVTNGPSGASGDSAVVVWRESGDRDGDAVPDDDVVAARITLADGTVSAVLLVSADVGTFIDDVSAEPRVAALTNNGAGDVLVGWINNGTRAFGSVVDAGDFASGNVGEPFPLSAVGGGGAVTDLALASAGGDSEVVIAWLDDGSVVTDANAAVPGVVVRRGNVSGGSGSATFGATRVVSTAPASSPAVSFGTNAADGVSFIQAAWIEGGDVFLFATEPP